jgi:hypothetical protein
VTPIAYSWFDDLGRLFTRPPRTMAPGIEAVEVVPQEPAAARRSKVS